MRAALTMLILVGAARVVSAQAPGRNAAVQGQVNFLISCSSEARREFARAVMLLHHMTYPEARARFERVAAIDPTCAMAQWGIAMTFFQPLWPTRPGPEDLRRGWDAVEAAHRLAPPTARERLFVAAMDSFYRAPDSPDYWSRIRRWAHGTEVIHAAFPDDPEAAAFHALALLANAPANTVSRVHADSAAALLVGILARNPKHPGAMHYLIHANDMPGREHDSLEIVRRYETVAPDNPHALHMPTHIHSRLGDWDAVIAGNVRAADAALQYHSGDHGQFVWDEFPHAIEYLVYGYLQEGADERAAAAWTRLRETAALQPSFKTAFHFASVPARYALERRDWVEAAHTEARVPAMLAWDQFPWPEAIAWFARGLGAAHLGRLDVARQAVTRIAELESAADRMGEDLFTRQIRILRLEADGWLAHAAGHPDSSIALLREAVDLESSTPKHAVTPGPTLPALELLGDLYLERNEPALALAAFRASLEHYPRRFNSLLGAARAAGAAADAGLARSYYRQLLKVAGQGTRREAIEEARAGLANAP